MIRGKKVSSPLATRPEPLRCRILPVQKPLPLYKPMVGGAGLEPTTS